MCESFILKMYNFNNHRLIYVMKILEKEQFWCQKWIFKNFGEFYKETVNIKIVDNI
jgi:hypothetical protein